MANIEKLNDKDTGNRVYKFTGGYNDGTIMANFKLYHCSFLKEMSE
jgi:hypothetical protein